LDNTLIIRTANADDKRFAEIIINEMAESAKARGTGIAKRSPEYVSAKMDEGKAVIALTKDGEWAGFCYIEAWDHEKFVANSGLIVSPKFRGTGIARDIKKKIFELSRKKYPDSKIFGLTTGLAVMKINSGLGYKPVTYSELTTDEEFWKGCRSCVNFDILTAKERKNCLCTAMLYDPAWEKQAIPVPQVKTIMKNGKVIRKKRRREFKNNYKLFERWIRLKRHILLNGKKKNPENAGSKKSIFNYLFFW